MPDVLATLQKLPAKCAAVIDGQAVFILRGAGYGPSFIGTDQVDQWNQRNGVNPQQVQAMVVGATLGWDRSGADPDTHTEEPGETWFDIYITVSVAIQIPAHTEEQALAEGRKRAEDLADRITFDIGSYGIAHVDNIDIIETEANNG